MAFDTVQTSGAQSVAHMSAVCPDARHDPIESVEPPGRTVMEPTSASLTVVIEHRLLVRECLVQCLLEGRGPSTVCAYATLDDWLATNPVFSKPPLVLFSTGDRKISDLKSDWLRLLQYPGPTPQVVLLAEVEEASCILDALNGGVKGYIPTSVPLCVALEAMHLVRAGGVFIPSSCLVRDPQPGRATGTAETPAAAEVKMFTGRQGAVIEAVRRGKSNKIIAYELAMAESTVKVHVRNIMRKLKAHNRTEVAFLLNKMEASRSISRN